jgi:hypothetical protein
VRKAEREIKLGIEQTFQPPAAPGAAAGTPAPPLLLDLRAPATGLGRERAATPAERTVAGGRGAGLDALRELVPSAPAMTDAAAPGPA